MEIKGKKYSLLFYKKQKDHENYCYAYFLNAVNENILDGKVLVEYLEMQNTPKSLYWLGCCYWHGFGVFGDLETCEEYYKLSYKRGNLDAGAQLACLYIIVMKTEANIAKAIKILKRGVKHNNPIALRYLGVFYNFGVCVPQDKIKGRKHLKRSAKQGFAISQHELGLQYMAENKLDKALYYLHLAGNNGNACAFNTIGEIYISPRCNRVDIDKAMQYLSKTNNMFTQNFLGFAFAYHTKDYKKAIFHYQQSIQMYENLHSWKQAKYLHWGTSDAIYHIRTCEQHLTESYIKSLKDKTLDKTEYVDAYELLLKYEKDLTQILTLLKPEYIKCLDLFGRDVSSIILPYLIKNI